MMVEINMAVMVGCVAVAVAYTWGYRKGTQTSAQATMLIMREFLKSYMGESETNMMLGKNFNRLARWMEDIDEDIQEDS
jgi:hypothetical protein|tara:strand:+ start:5042 stop:5278 length:237 start_codon:yes stop_codon:yes gene_type:complete